MHLRVKIKILALRRTYNTKNILGFNNVETLQHQLDRYVNPVKTLGHPVLCVKKIKQYLFLTIKVC